MTRENEPRKLLKSSKWRVIFVLLKVPNKQTNKQAQNEIPELYNIVLLKVPNKQAQNEIHELYNMKCLYIFSFFLSFFLCPCLLQSHFDRVSDWMKKKKKKKLHFDETVSQYKKKRSANDKTEKILALTTILLLLYKNWVCG